MNPVFATGRLDVREWESSQAERFLDMYSREDVVRFLGSTPSPLTSIDEAYDRIARRAAYNAEAAAAGKPFGSWAVVVRETGAVAGTVALVPVEGATGPDAAVEVAWHLHPDSQGHGYATEAAAGAFARGHDTGIAEILALTDPANTPSQAVCRRLGLGLVETSDRYYGKPLMIWVSRR